MNCKITEATTDPSSISMLLLLLLLLLLMTLASLLKQPFRTAINPVTDGVPVALGELLLFVKLKPLSNCTVLDHPWVPKRMAEVGAQQVLGRGL
jgi:hypothetical protein